MKMYRSLAYGILFATSAGRVLSNTNADSLPWSQRIANLAIERWPGGHLASEGQEPASNYELGTLLQGMGSTWLNTADPRYYNYIKSIIDPIVGPDGSIKVGKADDPHLDAMLLGRQLLLLYGVTQDQRYAKAATALYQQLFHQQQGQPASHSMQLDELFGTEPFYAEYVATFHHPEAFEDITRQFVAAEVHARDTKTGRLSSLSARKMGLYMMALVDTLSYYPDVAAGRKQLIGFLNKDADALISSQDGATGLWYSTLNKAGGDTDFPASCMLVYALARGVREGYLPESYVANAERGYRSILSHFLPGKESSVSPSGIGAFLLASGEMENVQNAKTGRGQTVMMDAWFNSQKRLDAAGQQIYFHYKWDDRSNSGYSLLGHVFRNYGARTETLYTAPTVANLHLAQIYIIVSPDIPVKNPNPHYMQKEDAAEIAEWVKAGGVLMIMENDPPNADIEHLNLLSERFGIHYNNVLSHHVDGDKFEMGTIAVKGGGPLFHDAHTIYMKDTCTISVSSPAVSLFRDRGDILMAMAKYGKGTVYATVDPWLYNEYADGRKLPPAEYDNYAAGKELVRWILEQVPHHAASKGKP